MLTHKAHHGPKSERHGKTACVPVECQMLGVDNSRKSRGGHAVSKALHGNTCRTVTCCIRTVSGMSLHPYDPLCHYV